ncbi:MAG TPA: penicillin-binding protein 1B [Steroidobacteraceae bacterium]|nr:penicillin-binding protein 1B [Steroidobacteraceae bacterium]
MKLRRLIVPGLLIVAACAAVATAYVLRLDHMVVHQFEGRRWTLPAQVYAAPVELYDGLPLSQSELEQELQRLSYRRVASPIPRDAAVRTGTYRKIGGRIDVGLRATRFADEARAAEELSITTSEGAITSLTDGAGREVPIVRLDPLLIGSIFPIHGEDRIIVTPGEVPPLLPAALIAVEDRDFETNRGISISGILRAIWVDIRAGSWEQGGSTLTQQLVRSYFLSPRRTASRKIREAIMAVSLDEHFSKADLMNAYINEIHLGQDGNRAIHGFGLAAEFYFGKPLSELDLEEIATLVAIVRGPSYYDPRRHPERVLKRRNLVLEEMSQQHVIPQREALSAEALPLGVTSRTAGAYYPAYLDLVRRTLRRDYREQDLTEAGLKVFTNLDPRVQADAEHILERELARLDRRRQAHVAHGARGARARPVPQLQGAIVVTTPQSGDVIAVVGGRDAGFDGFNRALDGRRQIGSLVKPFVYLTAIESGRFNDTSIIEDAPVTIKLSGGKLWSPRNFTRQDYGPVPLVRALAESLNDATVNLGMDVGIDAVAQTLQRFGLAAEPPRNPALLLGTVDLTPLEVAQLYGGLANGGFRTTLRAVRAVISAEGKPLKAFPVEVQSVAKADAVYQVDSMLEQVMERGTARGALAVLPRGLVTAGKTGTSSDMRDSWFAGFSGSDLAVVWVGYDNDSVTGLQGATGALNAWSHLMADISTSSWDAPIPDDLQQVTIDYPTGMRADGSCSGDLVTVPVPQGTNPAVKPGCPPMMPLGVAAGGPAGAGPAGGVGAALQRAGKWLQGLVH